MKTNNGKIKVGISTLRKMCTEIISRNLSISYIKASDIFDQILYAELCGKKTHGLVRIPWLLKRDIKGHQIPSLYKTDKFISHFDCSKSIGYLAANEIITYTKKKCITNDIYISIGHDIFPTGVLGYYTKKLLRENIVLIFGTTPNLVKFSNEEDKKFGTNPFSVGFSYGRNKFFIIDITTAQSSFGELLLGKYDLIDFNKKKYHTIDNRTPKDINQLFNSDGLFTGSILQNMDNKLEIRQFSLMLLVQCLTTLISQSETKVGDLVFVTIKRNIFGNKKVYEKILNKMKEDKIPGMHSDISYNLNKKAEELYIPARLWKEIRDLGSS